MIGVTHAIPQRQARVAICSHSTPTCILEKSVSRRHGSLVLPDPESTSHPASGLLVKVCVGSEYYEMHLIHTLLLIYKVSSNPDWFKPELRSEATAHASHRMGWP